MPSSQSVTTFASLLLASVAVGVVVYKLSRRRHCRERAAPRRYGGAIRLKKEKYRRYRKLHDNVWPQVLERLYRSNIRNFTIYYHQETSTLFSSFEWIGHWNSEDKDEQVLFERDMQLIADDPITKQWWKECEPCQMPFSQWQGGKLLSQGGDGDWWAPLECVAHCGYWPTAYCNQARDPDFVNLHLVS